MNEDILSKEEYIDKLNKLVKPTVDFAIVTKEFNDNGCFRKEFIKVGDKEVSLIVIDDRYITISRLEYENLKSYRYMCYDLKQMNEKLEKENRMLKEKLNNKKFFGIF